MKNREKRRFSWVTDVLFFFGAITGSAILSVLIFGTPAPLQELAVMTVVMMGVYAVLFGAGFLWKRVTRKRRSYLGG